MEKYEELVASTIDLEAVDNHEYLIKPEFDPAWAGLTQKRNELKKAIDAVEIEVQAVTKIFPYFLSFAKSP